MTRENVTTAVVLVVTLGWFALLAWLAVERFREPAVGEDRALYYQDECGCGK